MIWFALMLGVFPTTNDFMVTFDPVLSKQGFAFKFDHHAPGDFCADMLYIRQSDGHGFQLGMTQAKAQSDVDSFLYGVMHGNGMTNVEHSPSGVPLGEHCFDLDNGTEIVAAADGFTITMFNSNGAQNRSAESDERALEAVSRLAVAEMIGSTLLSDGTPVPANPKTNHRPHSSYMTFTRLKKLSRCEPVVGDWLDRCTVQLGKHKLEFALASDAVAIDGKWTIIEAFVARRKGEWMIPTKVLKEKGIL